MTVSCGSPIFGVRFCDTGVGVAHDDMAIVVGEVMKERRRRERERLII